jgi:hypothetical protein
LETTKPFCNEDGEDKIEKVIDDTTNEDGERQTFENQ